MSFDIWNLRFNVDACVMVYGEGESQSEVWPDVPKVALVLIRFKAMPELD